MQIQSVKNTPSFQANRLRTAFKLAENAGKYQSAIDIYSINSSDSGLIDKLLLKLDLKERTDSFAIKEKPNVNETIRNILTKAKMLKEDSSDGVYLAVQNGKRVTGFLDYTNSGMPLLKNLVAWRGKNQSNTRLNLFTEFLQRVGIKSQESITSYSEEKSKGNKWLRDLGFGIPPQSRYARQRLLMPQNTVSENAAKCEKMLENDDLKITQYSKPQMIELTNLDL